MTRVILIAPIVRFDTHKAQQFGEIVYLFEDAKEANPFNGQELMASFTRQLLRVNYDPNNDLIALTGPVAAVAMLAMAAADMANTQLQVLVYDARDGGSYRQRWLNPHEYAETYEDGE